MPEKTRRRLRAVPQRRHSPPAERPLRRRFLRVTLATVAALVIAFTVGQIMLASHADPTTQTLVGVAGAAAAVLAIARAASGSSDLPKDGRP